MIINRPGTLDSWIQSQIFVKNEYGLIPKDIKGKTVLDIGAHAGYFSVRCLQFGAKKVVAYEIEDGNFQICAKNLEQYGDRAELTRRAVWRSDVRETMLHFDDPPYWGNAINTGGIGVVFPNGGQNTVSTIALDDILIKHRFDLIKIDAESSEWPILLTSRLVFNVPKIIGEYHEIGGQYDDHNPKTVGLNYDKYDVELLESLFTEYGYYFRYDRYEGINIGHFWAWKR